MMGYLILALLLATAACGWRAHADDVRFGARMAALLCVVLAVQMWWEL
ncbi:hypothetical protein ACFYWS_39400 [Streptomyces sp. NPDC002795]